MAIQNVEYPAYFRPEFLPQTMTLRDFRGGSEALVGNVCSQSRGRISSVIKLHRDRPSESTRRRRNVSSFYRRKAQSIQRSVGSIQGHFASYDLDQVIVPSTFVISRDKYILPDEPSLYEVQPFIGDAVFIDTNTGASLVNSMRAEERYNYKEEATAFAAQVRMRFPRQKAVIADQLRVFTEAVLHVPHCYKCAPVDLVHPNNMGITRAGIRIVDAKGRDSSGHECRVYEELAGYWRDIADLVSA